MFAIDQTILTAYRRRHDAGFATCRQLYEDGRAARGERDSLISVARQRQQTGRSVVHGKGATGLALWLNTNEAAQLELLSAEVVKIDGDIQRAEAQSEYHKRIGRSVIDYAKSAGGGLKS